MVDLPNQTIQQIIPAMGDLFAKYYTDEGETVFMRIVCFALTVDNFGEQAILPMSMDSRGDIAPAGTAEIIDAATDALNGDVSD